MNESSHTDIRWQMLRDEREWRAKRLVLEEGLGKERERARETEKKGETGASVEGPFKGGGVEDYSDYGVYARKLAREL